MMLPILISVSEAPVSYFFWASAAHFADGEQRFHAMVSRHFARS
jgi:hypothetical protein